MKKFDFSSQKTESITHRILFGIVAMTFIVFFLFYIVGYDMPYIFEPEYNAPLLTDVLLIFLYFILALALAILVVSIVRGYKKRDRQAFENGIPVVGMSELGVQAENLEDTVKQAAEYGNKRKSGGCKT